MSRNLLAALALLASFFAHAGNTAADLTRPGLPGSAGAPPLPGARSSQPRPQNLDPRPTVAPVDAVAPSGPAPAHDKAGAATITSVSYTYDDAGNRSSMTLSNGVVTRYTYDRRDRLIDLHTTQDGETLQRHGYTLDDTGLRTGIVSTDADDNQRTTTYAYDFLRRLVSEIQTENGVEVFNASYSYDKVGNRTSSVVNGVTTTYAYDRNDWLLSETAVGGPVPGTTTYTYDDHGNRLTKSGPLGVVEYAYNDANRMVEMRDGADTIAYAYRADGLLASKTFFKPGLPPLTQRFVWDQNRTIPQVVEELADVNGGSPQVVANYFFADELIAQTRNGVTSFVVSDGMGSTRALTDTGGAITDTFRYDAFGNVIGRTGSTPTDHLYRGEQLDPNAGFYYLRARWMDPTIGRFTQMDSFAGFSSDPPSLHKYLYANADPVNRIDPLGNFSLIEISTSQNLQSLVKVYNVGSFAVDLYTGGLAGGARAIAEEIVYGKLSKFKPIAKLSDEVIGLFSRVWSRGVKLKLGLPYNSGHLRHNLEQLFGPLPANHAAHHIVPGTSPAMARLKAFGIDPNSPSNGVALPRRAGDGLSAPHSGGHCKQYRDLVERLIMGANDKEEVINALSLIRQDLLSGAALVQGCT